MSRDELLGQRSKSGVTAALYVAAAILVAQFLVSVTVAMAIYHGGSRFTPGTGGYHFFENTLSSLGRSRDYLGNLKPVTRWIFTAALVSSGAGLALFTVLLPPAFSSRKSRILSFIALPFGLGAAAGFTGIGLYPTDLHYEAHFFFVYLAFTSFLPVAVLLPLAQHFEGDFGRKASAVSWTFFFLLCAYLGLIYFGPPVTRPAGAAVQVAGQKIIVYAGIIYVTVEALIFSFRLRSRARQEGMNGS